MRGLEDGLRVADIAVFELETCEPNESIADVRSRARRFDLDNIPVRDKGTIVGVVEDVKSYRTDVSAASVAAPLTEAMLVAGSKSLLSFLPTIADRPYQLVMDESRIGGVVTPSDVVQLPVRLLVFALLAHIEELMRANIRQKEPNDDLAVEHLDSARLKEVRKTLRLQKKKGLNPGPLDVTQFIDKANLLFELEVVEESASDRRLFIELYELRNKVDHVDRYAETRTKLTDFLRHIRELEAWIQRLTDALPADFPAVGITRPW
jgi:hypothetical protein